MTNEQAIAFKIHINATNPFMSKKFRDWKSSIPHPPVYLKVMLPSEGELWIKNSKQSCGCGQEKIKTPLKHCLNTINDDIYNGC